MALAFPAAVPEIPVSNLDGALRYYTGCLGFTFDFGGGEAGIAGLSRGQCRIFLTDWSYRESNGIPRQSIIWLNLGNRDEVNELFNEWTQLGARLLSAPDAKPWNLDEFTAADPDNNEVRVFYDLRPSDNATGLVR
jgi:Glyoxalase/Bleomycin resistance protein/Dioxygenase superfamily